MNKTTQKVFWSIMTAALGGLCIWAVIKSSGMTPAQLWSYIRETDPRWLGLGVIFALGIIYFEGKAVLSILKNVGYPRRERMGFVYASADVYFSAITPSATGGQPASAFFMIRDGVPAAVVTAVLLANLISYNAAILSVGVLCLIVYPGLFLHFQVFCKILIILGILVLTGMGFLFIMLLRHQKPLFHATVRITDFLHRIHLLRHPQKWKDKLERAMEEYRDVVRLMAGKKKLWITAYFYNVMIRVSQFGVTVWLFLAMGGRGKLMQLWATQCYVSLGANCVPLPGAVGVTDYLMLDGYLNLMGQEQAYTLQLLARGLSFYCTVIVSALVVLSAYIIGKRKTAA